MIIQGGPCCKGALRICCELRWVKPSFSKSTETLTGLAGTSFYLDSTESRARDFGLSTDQPELHVHKDTSLSLGDLHRSSKAAHHHTWCLVKGTEGESVSSQPSQCIKALLTSLGSGHIDVVPKTLPLTLET
eukprot:981238-Amphidinium_carterae.1